MAFSEQGPKKETIYGGPPPKTEGTVYGGTVYDPSRQRTATRRRSSTSPEEARKFGNVFYVIAVFTMINTAKITFGFGGKTVWAIGLGVTRVFDAAVLKGGPIGPVLVINGIVICVFVILGIFARNGSATAFLIGTLLYVADALLLWQDGAAHHVPSLLFHAIFLVVMVSGFFALKR